MHASRTYSILMLACALTAAGCGSDDDDGSPAASGGVDADVSIVDAGADTTVDRDTAIDDAAVDMQPDTSADAALDAESGDGGEADAETGDAADSGEACVPEETRDARIATHESVAAGTADFESVGEGWRAAIDASLGGTMGAATSSWVYLDLDTPELIALSDAEAVADERWELAFKRSEIRLNSADSGPRALLLTRVEADDFASATPPGRDAEWSTDDFVTDECEVLVYGRDAIATAFGQWYEYDFATHTVTVPEGTFYFLYDASTHAVIKLQIESYEDGVYTIRWE